MMLQKNLLRVPLFLALCLTGSAPSAHGQDSSNADTQCGHDTHIGCGELVVWNDTQSPASTVLLLQFPKGFTARAGSDWSVRLSTCHSHTSAATTVKLFDACPLAPMEQGRRDASYDQNNYASAARSDRSALVRSAVASNSRDTSCTDAQRAASLTYFPQSAPYAKRLQPEIDGSDLSTSYSTGGSQEPQGYYAVVTAGARGGPSSGAPYHVALQLTCHDSAGLDLRAPLMTSSPNTELNAASSSDNLGSGSIISGAATPELGLADESSGSSSSLNQASGKDDLLLQGARQVASDSSTKLQQALRFERRLAGSTANTTTGPTSSPSLVPSSLAPSVVPSLAPSDSPTLLPSVSLLPSVTPAPTEVPTPDLCQTTTASCGTIVAGNTTGRYDYDGAEAGEVNFLVGADTPRYVYATACPVGAKVFAPSLRAYDGCPFKGGNALTTSAATSSAQVSLVANVTGASSLADCAVVVVEVSRDSISSEVFLTVDGASAGEEGGFELTVACELILYPSEAPSPLPSGTPSIPPTPPPSSTPSPSSLPVFQPTPAPTLPPTPVPTIVPARSNCACFSENMVLHLARYCPKLTAHFVEGCMPNVTRAVLKEYSANCTALKADWGPFFAGADDDYGSVPGYPFYDGN